ncbi:MAG: transposase, partial [Nitrospirae bacterium]|nr:transposase [Nitrospirota bacterium]
MRNNDTEESKKSMPEYEALEEWVRMQVQEFIQGILEEEVGVLFGRSRYERQKSVDGHGGYRNGYGKARKLSLKTGTVVVRRPRIRNTEEKYESRILPLFKRRTKEIGDI